MDYKKGMGAIKSPIDVRDYKAVCSAATTDFPEEYELHMPDIKDQGIVGACVAHSIATTIEYHSRNQGDDDSIMSTGYIYGNRLNSSHKGSGMVVRDAISQTCKYGTVPNELFSYNIEVPAAIQAFESKSVELFPSGYPNRLTSYYRLSGDAGIKSSLMRDGPVIFAMEWFDDIKIENGVIKTKEVPSGSYHCMVIYGWNEKGWKVQNSWGEDWGDEGRAILPFDVTKSEVWGVTDQFSEALRVLQQKENVQKISKLTLENKKLTEEVQSLYSQMSDLDKTRLEEKGIYENLLIKYNEKSRELRESLSELEKCEAEKTALSQELLEIKKPFSSPIGKFIASILNLLANIFGK